MNKRVIVYVLGAVLLIEAALMLLPLLRAGRPVDDALRADAVALGVAFEAQRVPEAAADEQDRQLDGFVTERKVYRGTNEFEL